MFGNAFSKFKKGQAAMASAPSPGAMPGAMPGAAPMPPIAAPRPMPSPVAAPVSASVPAKSKHPIHMLRMPKKFGRANA